MEKTIIGTKWRFSGVYEMKKEGNDWSYHRVLTPPRTTVLEFTDSGMIIVYYNGKENFRAPYVYMKGLLVFDQSLLRYQSDAPGGRALFSVAMKDNSL